MTQKEQDAIRARCDKATPGKWVTPPTFSGICSQSGDILAINRVVNTRDADMIFIAHARQDVPALLNALDAETKRADEMERKCQIECVDDLLFIWLLYALEADENLTPGARKLKNMLLSVFAKREDYDRLQARAEALERAIKGKNFNQKKHPLFNIPCRICIHAYDNSNGECCDSRYCSKANHFRNWQFDEVRFARKENP